MNTTKDDLQDLLRAWPLLLLGLVVGVVAGTGVGLTRPAEHTATAEVLVVPLRGNPFAPDVRGQNLDNIASEVELVTADPTLAVAVQKLGSDAAPADLLSHVSVDSPANTQVISITVTGSSAGEAERGATAFAEAFLESRRVRASAAVDHRVKALETALERNGQTLSAALTERGRTKSGTPERVVAEESVKAATEEFSRLQNELSTARTESTDPGQLLAPPRATSSGGGLLTVALPVAGGLAGAAVVAGLLWLRRRRDDRLHTVGDVEDLGYPVLGLVRSASGVGELRGLLHETTYPLPDDVRLLRTALAAAARRSRDRDDVGLTVALTTVPGAHDAVSGTWVALAAALARADHHVTLVDAGTGDLTSACGESATPGLSEALADPSLDVVRRVQPGLGFVAPGARPDQTAEKVLSPRMDGLLQEFRSTSAWVLYAAPAISRPEAIGLVTLARHAVVAVDLHVTTREALQQAVEVVERTGSVVVGVVAHEYRRRPRGGSGRPPVVPVLGNAALTAGPARPARPAVAAAPPAAARPAAPPVAARPPAEPQRPVDQGAVRPTPTAHVQLLPDRAPAAQPPAPSPEVVRAPEPEPAPSPAPETAPEAGPVTGPIDVDEVANEQVPVSTPAEGLPAWTANLPPAELRAPVLLRRPTGDQPAAPRPEQG